MTILLTGLLNTRVMAFCRKLLIEVGHRPGSMKLLKGISLFLAGPEWVVPNSLNRDQAIAYCDRLLTMSTLSPDGVWVLREIKGTLFTFSQYKKRKPRHTVVTLHDPAQKTGGVIA